MQEFEGKYKEKLIAENGSKRKYNSKLSMSEVMSIVVYYHNYGKEANLNFIELR